MAVNESYARMKMLHVIPSVDLRGGGPVEWVRQVCIASGEKGFTSEVASLDAGGDACVRQFNAPVHALGPSTQGYGYSKRFVPWLRENAASYDCIISHGIWQYTSLGTWSALRQSQVPYFVYVHGMLDTWFKRTYPLKHLKKMLYWLHAERHVFQNARAVFYTSEEERDLARQSFRPYRCSEAISPLGTTGLKGPPELYRDRFLEQFPGLRGKRLILYLSRIHVKKGCDLLIEAFAKVAPRDSSLQLVMAGPDPQGLRQNLEKRVGELGLKERVTWTGMLSGDLKWGALCAAELFALPSHQETFPVSVTEALGCGLPVLTSNRVNIWREIGDAGVGLIAEDSIAGTTKGLETWLTFTELQRQAMRLKARQRFADRYDVHKAVDLLLGNLSQHGIGN